MNPYDEYAVEEALRIKEAGKTTEVVILTLGPESALERIRTALAMGADRAVHIKENTPNVADATVVAAALAAALKGLDAGLILAGKQAVDDDGYSVPGMVAALLGVPHVNACSKVEAGDDKVTAWADIEGGAKLVIESRLPAVLTTTKGLNEPRYASLPGIMKAKKKPVETKSFADLGVSAAPKTEILGWTLPDERVPGRVLKGEIPDQVKELVKALREEAKVI
jgi:electron transfer flavoprotein beta subunit